MSSKFVVTSKIKSDKFRYVKGALVSDLADALYLEAELIMTDSKQNYVPVDSGMLRNSGTVMKPVISQKGVTVVLGYGGPSADYAVVVHEYPPSYGQGKNKYLSKPLNKAERGLISRVSEHMRKRVARKI
jgi:hypothetical protein